MSAAEGVKLVLHAITAHDTEQHRTGGCIESVSPLLEDGFVVRAGGGKLVRIRVKGVPEGNTLHPGEVTLAEALRMLLQEKKIGFVPRKIDFSDANVLLETAFLVMGGDGTLNDKPTLYRVTVEKVFTHGERKPVEPCGTCDGAGCPVCRPVPEPACLDCGKTPCGCKGGPDAR